MGNIGKIDNNKTADLLRDEEDNSIELNPAPTAGQALEDSEKEGDILEPKDPVAESIKQQIVETAIEQKKTGTTRTRKAPTKAVPSSQLIEKLKSQIVLIEYIEGVSVLDINPELATNKVIRDIAIEFQRSIEATKNEYLLKIQAL